MKQRVRLDPSLFPSVLVAFTHFLVWFVSVDCLLCVKQQSWCWGSWGLMTIKEFLICGEDRRDDQ